MKDVSPGVRRGVTKKIRFRVGKESKKTVGVLYSILAQALKENGFPQDILWGITDPDRKIPKFLLGQRRYIDVVVPRGGDKLIDFVVETSEIPIIKNDRGLCNVYVHEDADLEMAQSMDRSASKVTGNRSNMQSK